MFSLLVVVSLVLLPAVQGVPPASVAVGFGIPPGGGGASSLGRESIGSGDARGGRCPCSGCSDRSKSSLSSRRSSSLPSYARSRRNTPGVVVGRTTFPWTTMTATIGGAGDNVEDGSGNPPHPSSPRPTDSNSEERPKRVLQGKNRIKKKKRLILIRHGKTYMNEHLSTEGSMWGDSTFRDDWSFRDSPLSPTGVRQATELGRRLERSAQKDYQDQEEENSSLRQEEEELLLDRAWNELELVVVSPLTRTLQTFHLGMLPHLPSSRRAPAPSSSSSPSPVIPIIALPLASERMYLTSDVGTPVHELRGRFPVVDFESEFHDCLAETTTSEEKGKDQCWWWSDDKVLRCDDYVEWRPYGEGQHYVCRGEPDNDFFARMTKLRRWLIEREEQVIALVCHWGVIEYLTGGEDFDNCEARCFTLDVDADGGGLLGQQGEDEEEEEVVV